MTQMTHMLTFRHKRYGTKSLSVAQLKGFARGAPLDPDLYVATNEVLFVPRGAQLVYRVNGAGNVWQAGFVMDGEIVYENAPRHLGGYAKLEEVS